MNNFSKYGWLGLTTALLFTGCAGESIDTTTGDELAVGSGDFTKVLDGKGDASIEAIMLDFEFDGHLVTNSRFNAKGQIDEQLLYTIGHLNGDNSVGRLDRVDLSNVQTTDLPDGTFRVDYHAKMLVAWGKRDNVPQTYELKMPKDVSNAGLEAFTEAYSHSCVDFGAHDVDTSSMWYYYRPNQSRCQLKDDDIAAFTATATVSDINTTGKYPEYDKIWEDDVLKAVVVFGKNEADATQNWDAGISAYNSFLAKMKTELREFDVVTEPADVASNPGVNTPDVTFRADLGDGKSVEIVALLVDGVRVAGPEFDARYEELSGKADFIAYFGHSGLGANIRALARKGRWEQGQYVVVFMNGCDTYTYVDRSLADAHAAVNPNQESDYQYIDLLMNAMPAFFRSNANNAVAVIRALMSFDDPLTYEKMFEGIDSAQVVIVSGEQDNKFVPGGGGDDGDTDDNWTGLDEAGEVAAGEEIRFGTPVLPAGKYTFQIEGTNDADLYIRIGADPSESRWDCRPFKTGSAEICSVDLPSASTIGVMVRGWAAHSTFTLKGRKD